MPRRPKSRTRSKTTTTARARIWRSMRIMRVFTRGSLAATAETGVDNVGTYLRALTQSGHIVVARARCSGIKGGEAVYRLARNTGPYPPSAWIGGGVFDPNTGIEHPPPATNDPGAGR